MPDPNQTVSLHGVFMEVFDMGILISGASGIGKSEIGLNLVDRGHTLIADDIVFLSKEQDSLVGRCPPILKNLFEIRGLGIIDVAALYGDTAVKPEKHLQFIVNLLTIESDEWQNMDRIQGLYRSRNILGIRVPEVSIPVGPGRNLSILIEIAVRNEHLKRQGFNPAKHFAEKQLQLMEENLNDC